MSNYTLQLALGFEELYTKNRTVNFFISVFEELDLSDIIEYPFSHKKSNAGKKPVSRHNLFRAIIVMKLQRLKEVSQLLDYLENNRVIAMLCGFSDKLPKCDVFYRFLAKLSNDDIQKVISKNVLKLVEQGVIDLSNAAVDGTPVFANTKQNNPKSFSKNKFKKDNQPKSDKDCKLGIYTASNDNTNKKTEFYWGYKNHVIIDTKTGLPLIETTTTANCYEPYVAVELLSTAKNLYSLENKLKYLIADKGYDTTDFHQFVKSELSATAIIPLKSNSKAVLFDGDIPFCEAGLKMHKDGHRYRKTSVRFKFCCPYKLSKSKTCPCNNENFQKPAKNKGCIKWMHIKCATQRNSIDRNSVFFKSLYKTRTSIERYNARFKYLETEKPVVRNQAAIANLNSFAHLSLLLVAAVSVKNNNLSLIRSLSKLKKIA